MTLDLRNRDITKLVFEGNLIFIEFLDGKKQTISFPNLENLFCSDNHITTLEGLPKSLKSLYCTGNKNIVLDNLPNGLEILYCGYCDLISLDSLPESLEDLSCHGNNFKRLNKLPRRLKYLRCLDCFNLTELDNLPTTLVLLKCRTNHLLTYIEPIFPFMKRYLQSPKPLIFLNKDYPLYHKEYTEKFLPTKARFLSLLALSNITFDILTTLNKFHRYRYTLT